MTKPTFMGGEDIEFHFVSPYYPAEDKAWIGIIPASIPHGSEWNNDKHDVSLKHLDGALQGKFEICKFF